MIIILLVSILVGLAFVLYLLIRHRLHLRAIAARLDRVPVNNEELLKDVVREENAATRLHVSQAFDGMKHAADLTKLRLTDFIDREQRDAGEMRGQLTVVKARLTSVIFAIDEIKKRLIAIPAQIIEWFNNRDKPQ